MTFDTYVGKMSCPTCGHENEVVVQDTRGENLMRTLRPYDTVTEFASRELVDIPGDGDCEGCGGTFPVHIPIRRGIVSPFSDQESVLFETDTEEIEFLLESCMVGADMRHTIQRKMDVMAIILRFWITSRDGGDIPSEWHVSEPGLPVIGASTSAEDLIRCLADYLKERP